MQHRPRGHGLCPKCRPVTSPCARRRSGRSTAAPSPGARPFVEVGDAVGADDTVCLFEVMKLFSSLNAGAAGVVAAILVANESLVEQDQPLILIKPR